MGARRRSRSRSARRSCRWRWSPSPPSRSPRGWSERAHALGHGVRADRDGAGHRPGGARPRGPHARGRALHRLPRRAGDAARARTGRARGATGDPGGGGRRREREWTGADLRERIAFASIGLDLPLDADALERGAAARRPARASPAQDLQRLVVLNAKALMERDAEFSRFAGRILLTYVYEETLGWDIVRDGVGALQGRPPARARHALRARREDRADRPAAARVRPRSGSPRRSTRPPTWTSTSSGCRRSTTATCIVDKTGARAAPARGAAAVLAARRDGRLPRRAGGRARRAARIDLYAIYKPAPLLLVDADAVQRRHAALAALVLLPLQDRGHAVLDRRARHRRERDVLEVGGRPRRLVDRGARHRLRTSSPPTARARASCRS